MPKPTKVVLRKICVVGDIITGKSAFLERFINDNFLDEYKPTIGVDFGLKSKTIDMTLYRFQLWDIGGSERFGDMTSLYYKEASIAIIMVDHTRKATLDAAIKWKEDLCKELGNEIPIILLVNKIDVVPLLEFEPVDHDKFCQEHGINKWLRISCRDGTNIENVCDELIKITQEFPSVDDNENEDPFGEL